LTASPAALGLALVTAGDALAPLAGDAPADDEAPPQAAPTSTPMIISAAIGVRRM
jgi:hypothetical protein